MFLKLVATLPILLTVLRNNLNANIKVTEYQAFSLNKLLNPASIELTSHLCSKLARYKARGSNQGARYINVHCVIETF